MVNSQWIRTISNLDWVTMHFSIVAIHSSTFGSVNHYPRGKKSTNDLGPAWQNIAETIAIRWQKKIYFSYLDPKGTLESKRNDLKPLFSRKKSFAFQKKEDKSWYTGGGSEQGFLRCFTDGLKQSQELSVAQTRRQLCINHSTTIIISLCYLQWPLCNSSRLTKGTLLSFDTLTQMQLGYAV